jgi:flagellar export protein FliJ
VKGRFEFRLARIRRVRVAQEVQARATWARAEAQANEQERHCERLRVELDAARTDIGRAALDGARPERLLVDHEALAALQESSRAAYDYWLTLRGQADRLSTAWNDCRAAVEALDRLEDRSRKEFQAEAEREANLEMDEIASMRGARRIGETG